LLSLPLGTQTPSSTPAVSGGAKRPQNHHPQAGALQRGGPSARGVLSHEVGAFLPRPYISFPRVHAEIVLCSPTFGGVGRRNKVTSLFPPGTIISLGLKTVAAAWFVK